MTSVKDMARQLDDPEFLAAHAVEASPADWAPGPGEVGYVGGDGEEDVSARTIVKGEVEPPAATPEAPTEETPAQPEGEAPAVEGEQEAAPTPRFTSQEEAERAYAEAQRFAAQRDSEADLLRRRLEQVEQRIAEQEAAARVVPTVDPTSDIVGLVERDPIAAFRTAQESAPHAIPAVIAAVQADATQYAQQAAIRRSEGDEETAAYLDEQARSAAYVAEQMRAESFQSAQREVQQQQAASMFTTNLQAATAQVHQETGGAAAVFAPRIAEILEAEPHLLGDGSAQAAAAGVRSAYNRAYGEWAQSPEGQAQIAQHAAAQAQTVAQQQAEAQQQAALEQRRSAAVAQTHGSAQAAQLNSVEQDAYQTRDLLGLEGNPRPSGVNAFFAL